MSRRFLTISLLAALATACTTPPAAPPDGSPTASPVASTSPAATTKPSASPATTASPSAAPTATPTPVPPLLDMTTGRLLRRFDFKGIGGIYYEFAQDQLAVVDAENSNVTPRQYMLRRFKRDGSFVSSVRLAEPEEDSPDAVDGFAFDLGGVPIFTYREEEAFSLRKLYTATVQPAVGFPGTARKRAGIAALGADGNVLTLAVMGFDPDEREKDLSEAEKAAIKRLILYTRAEENEPAEAIFRLEDPLKPTVSMTVGPGGVVYLVGPDQAGKQVMKRLDKEQHLTDGPVTFAKRPDDVFTDPAGDLYLVFETTGNVPARIERYSVTGEPKGASDLKTAAGDTIVTVEGMTFDAQGHPLLAGTALTADLVRYSGIFEYDINTVAK